MRDRARGCKLWFGAGVKSSSSGCCVVLLPRQAKSIDVLSSCYSTRIITSGVLLLWHLHALVRSQQAQQKKQGIAST